jgi:DNA polymerase III alpha subunit
VTAVANIGEATRKRLLGQRAQAPFVSLADTVRRVAPQPEELEALVRVGAFDEFGRTRLEQFWDVQQLVHGGGDREERDQTWLLPPPTLDTLPTA